MNVQYESCWGRPIQLPTPIKVKTKRESAASFHKGWVVKGLPPGSLERARDAARAAQELASKSGGSPAASFDENAWRAATRLKRVDVRPYELPCAAQECARLAAKAGWTDLVISELKKEISA